MEYGNLINEYYTMKRNKDLICLNNDILKDLKKLLCNTVGATHRAGTVDPSGAPEFTPDFRNGTFSPL